MIKHETFIRKQCVVTFGDGDVNAGTCLETDAISKKEYHLLLLSEREIQESNYLDTIPCILRFQKPEDVDSLIEALGELKASMEKHEAECQSE